MTRVVCTADLQLGAGAGYLPAAYGPGSRLDDHARAWLRVVELAIERDADAIIVAGDVFEEKRPGPPALVAFQRGLNLARAREKRVIVIPGNHDVRSADEPIALEIFGDPEHDSVMVHRHPTWEWLTLDVAYAVLPWTTIGGLAAIRDGGDRDLLHAEAGELLAQVAAGMREEIRQAGATHAILIAHWAVSGAAMPTGISTDELREVVIPAHALDEQGWDAIVLGHIHRPQLAEHGAEGARFYCGSPLPCDFGEAGFEHGAWLLDVEQGSWTTRFLPIESRPFVTLDVRRLDEAPARLDDAIVRVVGKITRAESDICDRDFVAATLKANGAAAVRIDVEVERETRARADHVTKDLGPAAALDAWIDTQKPDVDHAAMRARHHSYLEQEAAA